ncbi:MAG: hypothetical protein JWN61_2249 [Pseudonocardiales bacterium]|nr:hypothetical protein [Pseudonocardiales bacterium]
MVGVSTDAAPEADLAPSPTDAPEPGARTRRAVGKPDPVAAAAHDLALAAALEVGGEHVGAALGIFAEAERLVVHRFDATLPGYRGWHWAVSVARAPRAKVATVCEVVLLPGDEALQAPQWVPWSERIRAEDLRPGDVLPTTIDDPRLVPGYTLGGDPAVDAVGADGSPDPDTSVAVRGPDDVPSAVAREWGLGRVRVLSRDGRADAAARWLDGTAGGDSPMVRQAPGHCDSCGFYLPLAGSLGGHFGACGNEFSPSDGRVVSIEHGCGAHSEALVVASADPAPAPHVADDEALDAGMDLVDALD